MKKNKRHGTGLPRRRLVCPVCGGKLKVVKDAVFKQECKGEKLVVKSPASLCAHCERQFILEGQGDQLRRNTADEYRRRHDLLSSFDIEKCRRRLKMSVGEFAQRLQRPAKEVRRWAKWLVQDETTDQRIRKLFGPFYRETDPYERFLTGHMSARRLCTEVGFADEANQLVHVFWGLQAAYDRLVEQKANCKLLGVVRVLRSGKLTAKEAEEIFGLNANALTELIPPRSARLSPNSDIIAALQAAEGGSWSGAELKRRFGFTAGDICYRRLAHGIIFWKDAKGTFRYPRWQFTSKGTLLPGIAQGLQILRSDDTLRIQRYFIGARKQLQGRRPLDLLRAGEVEKVLAHLRVQASENTW